MSCCVLSIVFNVAHVLLFLDLVITTPLSNLLGIERWSVRLYML